ncbi:hypothetical protein [Natrarchaeobaculum sulfurireducens]|uniref:Uncharacterized protein n=1 Tax=Natrarchaeobaculum sulfurireducens TaxID=2044521 RepID=A0A346PG00_9EURY|nr:hypothetical protein [Natrarchaeobaculum sulfurireducens]AXR78445.1 hypothetical protein AArc1_2127 [Natrarchaeobaculum sulfurireducens]AXR81528.1 hypothetical protein AArcMg_1515 [Natrarchaeobaculum sulfurireducens]
MADETTAGHDESIEDDPTDSLDVEHAEQVQIGVSRGESDLEIGPPRDYPDRADVAVRPKDDDTKRLVLSVDAMAGDHGTGHADVELTPTEASRLAEQLERTVRWMTDDELGN